MVGEIIYRSPTPIHFNKKTTGFSTFNVKKNVVKRLFRPPPVKVLNIAQTGVF